MPRERSYCLTLNNVREVDEDQLERLYCWVDEIPLSRQKKNLGRDFADAVMAAEVIKHFLPNHIDLHNYAPANGIKQKESNWYQLNKKSLKRLSLEVSPDFIHAIAQCKPWAAENFLLFLHSKIDAQLADNHSEHYPLEPMFDWPSQLRADNNDRPEADQNSHSGFTDDYQYNTGRNPSYGQRPALPTEPVYQPSKPLAQPGVALHPKSTPKPLGKKKAAEMVPKAMLLEKERELEERCQTVEILNTKVQRLEHLLQLKDIRIEDLTGRVELMEKQVVSTGRKPALKKIPGASPRANPGPGPPNAGAGGSYNKRWA